MTEGLRVIAPGLFTTVQDLGRPGYREWGVPVGGAFDARSSRVANALLGNDAHCATLEMTLSGGVFLAECPLAIALAGAPIDASILGVDARDRPFHSPGCGMIQAGEKLILGRMRGGSRAYLAVKGGWQTSIRLGSRSSEIRLQNGDLIPAASAETSIRSRYLRDWGWIEPSAGPIRVLDGPDSAELKGYRPDWWDHREWRIGSKSNRMGLRLDGTAVEFDSAAPADRLSAPVAPGAIQMAGGNLIVLGMACGTMGGYPHVAHVISADLARLGQLGPGDVIRFRRVELDEAMAADAASRRDIHNLALRIVAVAGDGNSGNPHE